MFRLSFITFLLIVSYQINAQSKPINIAIAAPFSGPYAAYGTQLLSGATQAMQDINKLGGIKGVMLELTPIDDGCNPDLALSHANKIVKDKNIHAVIGHACSSATLVTSNIYGKANYLVLTPSSTSAQITQRNVATLFRMVGNDNNQSMVAARFIVNKLKSKKIAILHDQDLYSKGLADLVSENLVHLGTSPALYQAIPRGTRNFQNIVKKLKALNIDCLYFAGLYPEVGALAQALNALELQIPLVSADAIVLQKFVQATGSRALRSVVMSFSSQDNKNLVSNQSVLAKMKQNKLETIGYSLYAYSAVQAIAKAMDSTNSTDGKVLANWLHHNEVETVLGKKSWDTNGDISDCAFKMFAWGTALGNLDLIALE